MTGSAKKGRRIPPGLARVRKQVPPPGKIFKDKHRDERKRVKEELRREIKESRSRRP